jgi:hypothetical protein
VRREVKARRVLVGKPEAKWPLGRLDVDGRATVILMVKKQGRRL